MTQPLPSASPRAVDVDRRGGGIGREFEERAKAMGAAVPDSQSLSGEIDSEDFKMVADRVIDCTGDADVAHRAGAPTCTTPAEEMQAASVMFHLSGVDKQAFPAGITAGPATHADWSAGEWAVETSARRTRRGSPAPVKRIGTAG